MDLTKVRNWRDAVCVVVDEKTNKYECFSSGEVTEIVRQERPDIKVFTTDVGDYLRNLFFNGAIRYGVNQAYQVARYTQGLGQTRAGQLVYVYAPTQFAGESHNFEVRGTGTSPTQTAQTTSKPSWSRAGASVQTPTTDKFFATVQGDGRLAIPGPAFVEYARKTGATIAPGAVVYAGENTSFYPDKILVSTRPLSGPSKKYTLSRDLGRIKFTPTSGRMSWQNGDRFAITFSTNSMEVDLSKTV